MSIPLISIKYIEAVQLSILSIILYTRVSSTYMLSQHFMKLGMSLMQYRSKRGLGTVPCGTPDQTPVDHQFSINQRSLYSVGVASIVRLVVYLHLRMYIITFVYGYEYIDVCIYLIVTIVYGENNIFYDYDQLNISMHQIPM